MSRLNDDGAKPRIRGNSRRDAAQTSSAPSSRILVIFRDGASSEGLRELEKFGILHNNMSRSAGMRTSGDQRARGVVDVLQNFDIAIVNADPAQEKRLLSLTESSAIFAAVPDLPVKVADDPPAMVDATGRELSENASGHYPGNDKKFHEGFSAGVWYQRGYNDAASGNSGPMLAGTPASQISGNYFNDRLSTVINEDEPFTWAIKETGVDRSPHSGQGVRIAVLDTGYDPDHPDFKGRNITPESFVQGATPRDGNGHGTHCLGIAVGPRLPKQGPRFGCAYGAEIFVGKVLGDDGSGWAADVLYGVDWALNQGSHIISLSLGIRHEAELSFKREIVVLFDRLGERALASNTKSR